MFSLLSVRLVQNVTSCCPCKICIHIYILHLLYLSNKGILIKDQWLLLISDLWRLMFVMRGQSVKWLFGLFASAQADTSVFSVWGHTAAVCWVSLSRETSWLTYLPEQQLYTHVEFKGSGNKPSLFSRFSHYITVLCGLWKFIRPDEVAVIHSSPTNMLPFLFLVNVKTWVSSQDETG